MPPQIGPRFFSKLLGEHNLPSLLFAPSRTVCSGLIGLLWATFVGLASAAPVLRCQFEVNAETHEHAFEPIQDPYAATSVDLSQRFRFKAVVLGDGHKIDLINLYVYHQTRRQPMLMQHVKFVAPVAQEAPAADALTGQMAVYSPFLGKELQYRCALHQGVS